MHAESLPGQAMMHTDALVERAREGDKQAQGRLVHLWYKRIYNYGYKFFFDHDAATEVAQKTFIAMCRYIGTLQDAGRFKSWLYTIAVNTCREELRRQSGRQSVSLDSMMMNLPDDSPRWEGSDHRYDNPERRFQQQELADLLQACLKELSAEQREVVIMKEYEGFKFREIAEALNVSENTVKSRLYYGLDALKKILAKRNITQETISYES